MCEGAVVIKHVSVAHEASPTHLGQICRDRRGVELEDASILARLLAESQRAGGDALFVAMVYAGLGQVDETFDWLERSVDDHSINYNVREPYFDALRGDPRFGRVLRRVGLEGG